jgi:ABC-2 type transport system ATP-binding protein
MVTRAPNQAARDATLTSQPAIEVDQLSKMYPGDVKALQDLSFQVPTGSIFGLLGPNGAGKSTVVKILTTLTRPDFGRALVTGVDAVREPRKVRRLVGYVSQAPAVDPEATGRENLMLHGQLYGMKGSTLRQRVDELLAGFDLADVSSRLVKTYSGGMKRKLDVAMGLVHQPRVLFLDEPTTGLDPEARAEMWQQIRHLARDQGITILLTTHYLEEADQLADLVAIIDRGQVVVEGTPEQLKQTLHGDTIRIELDDVPDQAVIDVLRHHENGVHAVEVDGREVRARVSSGATSLPAIMSALSTSERGIVSVTVARPSLDDVYLRYAGRTFAAAHERGSR